MHEESTRHEIKNAPGNSQEILERSRESFAGKKNERASQNLVHVTLIPELRLNVGSAITFFPGSLFPGWYNTLIRVPYHRARVHVIRAS